MHAYTLCAHRHECMHVCIVCVMFMSTWGGQYCHLPCTQGAESLCWSCAAWCVDACRLLQACLFTTKDYVACMGQRLGGFGCACYLHGAIKPCRVLLRLQHTVRQLHALAACDCLCMQTGMHLLTSYQVCMQATSMLSPSAPMHP